MNETTAMIPTKRAELARADILDAFAVFLRFQGHYTLALAGGGALAVLAWKVKRGARRR